MDINDNDDFYHHYDNNYNTFDYEILWFVKKKFNS